MRDTILVLARDATVRAQLAQALHSAGHVAELAESPVHARSVMVGKLLSLAIVAPTALGPEGLDLIDELRATIGRVLMVGPPGHPTGGAATTVDPANPTVLLAKVAEALRPCVEPDAPAPRLRFAGHVLDPGAHVLTDATGDAVALTPREFALLHEFVRRPGRVMARDHLSRVLVGRDAEPYERGIDMLVMRLRRKIERDPQRPVLIVTLPGAGYRFDAKVAEVCALEGGWSKPDEPGATMPSAAADRPAVRLVMDTPPGPAPTRRRRFAGPAWLAATAACALAIAAVAWSSWPASRVPDGGPVIAVLPFADLGEGHEQGYFGTGVAEDLRTLLATFPGLRVVGGTGGEPRPAGVAQARRALGADYALEGGVLKGTAKVRVTAQLIDTRTGQDVWASRYDAEGSDVIALQETVANKIYDSVAGLEGHVRKEEERNAWRKAAASLTEYDFYLRGNAFLFRGTCDDTVHARTIWQEGLAQFPKSALLKIKIAFSYSNNVEGYCSSDPGRDIDRAWALGRDGMATADKSPLATWLGHWLMTILYQWHDNDFERSAAEAEATAQLVPYDTRSRASLAFYLANGGKLERAAEWASWAAHRSGEKLGYQNLAWAYYLMGRYGDALASLGQGDPTLPGYSQQLATVYVRLGRIDEARAVIRDWMKANPHDSIAFETSWPLLPAFKQAYVADLRRAGLPD